MKVTVIDDIVYVDDVEATRMYGRGTRVKYSTDKYVVKFDDFPHWEQSTNEVEIWKRIEKRDRKYFAKLLNWRLAKPKSQHNGWIVQERIKFVRGRHSQKATDIITYLVEKYNLKDIGTNRQNKNWGIRADTKNPCIYDWGGRENIFL